MIYTGTTLNVCDNSGVKWVQCLKILGRKPKSCGIVGDIIVVSVKKIKYLSKIKKKEIHKALIVRVRKQIKRVDGSNISFSQNSVVLLNIKGGPIGTRIFGPVSKELRLKKNMKLVSLCSKIL